MHFLVTILLTLYKVTIDKPNRVICDTKDRLEGTNTKRRENGEWCPRWRKEWGLCLLL